MTRRKQKGLDKPDNRYQGMTVEQWVYFCDRIYGAPMKPSRSNPRASRRAGRGRK